MSEKETILIDGVECWLDHNGAAHGPDGRIVRRGAGRPFTPETSAQAREKKRARREIGALAAQAALVSRVQWWLAEARAGRPVAAAVAAMVAGEPEPGAGGGPAQRAPLTVGEAAEVVLGTLVDLALGPGAQAKDRMAAVRMLLQSGMLSGEAQETQEATQGTQGGHTLVLVGAAADRVAALLGNLGHPAAGGPGTGRLAEESDHPDTSLVSGGLGGGSPRSQVSGPHPADPRAAQETGVLDGAWRDLVPGAPEAPPEGTPAAAGGPGGVQAPGEDEPGRMQRLLARPEVTDDDLRAYNRAKRVAEETPGDLDTGGDARGACPGCGVVGANVHLLGCPKAAEEF